MSIIYLASRSPRRRQLLDQIGQSYELLDVEVDESQHPDEPAPAYVRRVALAKARAGRAAAPRDCPVLAADTAVVLDGEILGKPQDRRHAMTMLLRLSGRSHEVFSAVAVASAAGEDVRVNRSRLCFRPISEAECAAYCDSDEPWDKAGAYAIQGRAAAFIERLEGSYSAVMGLPLYETSILLAGLDTSKPG